jgi:hypothetical protein
MRWTSSSGLPITRERSVVRNQPRPWLGEAKPIVNRAVQRHIVVVSSEPLLGELERVRAYPACRGSCFATDRDDIELEHFVPAGAHVSFGHRLPKRPAIVRSLRQSQRVGVGDARGTAILLSKPFRRFFRFLRCASRHATAPRRSWPGWPSTYVPSASPRRCRSSSGPSASALGTRRSLHPHAKQRRQAAQRRLRQAPRRHREERQQREIPRQSTEIHALRAKN